jgi:hypothetical protein
MAAGRDVPGRSCSVGMSRGQARRRLEEVEELLSPRAAREKVLGDLDDLFRTGAAPDPPPNGFHAGRPITATISRPLDALGKRLAAVYMPWLGKSFDAPANKGINVLTKAALGPMKVLWPGYEPLGEDGDRIEAFPFETRLAPGAVDSQTTVLKIDYDLEENPALMIRRVLDELVEIDDGVYLGKVLFRAGSRFRRIGFFSLVKE